MFNRSFDDSYFNKFEDVRSNYSFEELEQINTEGARFYQTPSGARYPSMSSVTKLLSEKAIHQWRARVGEEEAKRVSSHASRRGTKVHSLAEHYLLNQRDQFLSTYRSSMADVQTNWAHMKRHLDEHITQVRASECRLYSHKLRLAGTTDLIAVYDGKLSVIDFKTSGKEKKREWIDGYFVQGDGYGCMWEELTGETPEQVVILIATDARVGFMEFAEPYGASLSKLKQLRLQYYKKFFI